MSYKTEYFYDVNISFTKKKNLLFCTTSQYSIIKYLDDLSTDEIYLIVTQNILGVVVVLLYIFNKLSA